MQMEVDQSLRGAGIWRCPALHISWSCEHQSPEPDQSNTYTEKDSDEVGIGLDCDPGQSQIADAGWTSIRPLHPERKPTTDGLGSVCCFELGGVLGIPRSPFGHIADSTDLLAGSWGGGPAGHADAAVSLDSFEAACRAGVLSLLAAPSIQRLRYWMLIRVS